MSPCYYDPHRREVAPWTPSRNPLIPFRHHLSEIEQRFATNINNLANNLAISGVEKFRNWILTQTLIRFHYPTNTSYTLEELTGYFNIFDKDFFFGALSNGVCCLKVIEAGSDEWNTNINDPRRLDGYARRTYSSLPELEKPYCTITIYERPADEADGESRLRHCVGTLLHEMVHCFIMVYTCPCPSCAETFKAQYGQKHHGETWHILATDLQKAVRDILGIAVDLGIDIAMAEEWFLSGANLQEVELRGLSHSIMEQLVDLLRR